MFFKNAFKEDFLAKTVVYISSLETLPEKLQSLGEKQYTTLEARFIANLQGHVTSMNHGRTCVLGALLRTHFSRQFRLPEPFFVYYK